MIDARELATAMSRYSHNPALEHYWIRFAGDEDLRMCARCEAVYPSDAPCIDAPLSPNVSAQRIVEAIALLCNMSTDEARAGLIAFVRGLVR